MASRLPSFEQRLLLALAVIAVLAIVGTLAILPYRLYERDIRNAKLDAYEKALLRPWLRAPGAHRGTGSTGSRAECRPAEGAC